MTTTDTPRTDAYYAGKGCECSANNRSECGCDVDWTDPRIYELQAEVADLKQALEIANRSADDQMFQKREAEAEVERLQSTMRSFIDFMDENLGTTADWPMEAAFDDEETCQRHCDHLNAMKRLVKPENSAKQD